MQRESVEMLLSGLRWLCGGEERRDVGRVLFVGGVVDRPVRFALVREYEGMSIDIHTWTLSRNFRIRSRTGCPATIAPNR